MGQSRNNPNSAGFLRMNGLPYYKAYPRDFIEGTIGMPFEIKCAYRVILDLIYMQGGNLPDDARYISGLLGCSIRKWKSIRAALVEADKVQVSGEFLTNYRAVKELETLAKLQDNQRENASQPRKNNGLGKPRQNQPEPEPEPELKRDTSVSPKKPVRRAVSLPDDWVPSQKNIQDARDKDFTDLEIQNEADKFRDYHLAKGTTFKDWDAGWRTWVRNARKFSANSRVVVGAFPQTGGFGGGIAGEVARRRAAGDGF